MPTNNNSRMPPMKPPTLVTAVFNLGRDKLEGNFRRDADHYHKHLKATLAIDCPMVIYTEAAFVEQIQDVRGSRPTRIIATEPGTALDTATLRHIETIRHDPEWRAQAGWLPQSPQAALPGYNALVLSKPLWLKEQAEQNPFDSTYVYWIDAALSHTVPPELLNTRSLERLMQFHDRFLLLCFPYNPFNEVHGFAKNALAELSGVETTRWVARGGFFGGNRTHVVDAARLYLESLKKTLAKGLMGTEESLLTLLSYREPDLFDLQFIPSDGLVWPFFQQLQMGWQGDKALARAQLADLTETWFISFNAPRQFAALLQSIVRNAPELLNTAERVLVNNSTDTSMFAEYDQLCSRHGIRQIRQGNLGINSARLLAAEQFYRGGRHAMFWFEDDMLPVAENQQPAMCKSGFPRHVRDLVATGMAIQQREHLDYLKLSFTEFYGNHAQQWGIKNMEPDEKKAYARGEMELPAAELSAPGQVAGVSYVTGEVFYSNWPHLMNRRGTKLLLLDDPEQHKFEQYWTARSYKLLKAGQLRAAVLQASPIDHQRIQEYPPAQRLENTAKQTDASLPAPPLPVARYTPRQPHPPMPGTIFVSIANYRDNETPRTLRDLYANAAQPERIFVGVFSQVVPGEDNDCLPADGFPPAQVRQLFIHADEGLGACWARSRILTELYGGEDYILQIDSHSRFVPGWDNGFIAMLGQCASERPILTTYPAGYYPPDKFADPHTPILAGLEFNQHGILLVKGIITDDFEFPSTPKPSAFLSGNCLFSAAKAFRQVPYDPYLYFHGEEISYAVRMWTHGWDLFAPNDVLMYTDYTSNRGRRRHWDDQKRWHELNMQSFQRLRHLFRLENITDPDITRDFERYNLGKVRTLPQYEAFADVSFATHYFGPRSLNAQFPLPGQHPAASSNQPRIFVSIASYRDSETAATIRDLFARASFPERVFVGVCTQIMPETDAACLPDDHPNVRELRIHAKDSRGPCWARYHILDQLLQDEDYVLQIDSHSRFSQGWDERFINMYLDCPSPHTILSANPAAYEPGNDVLQTYYSICTADKFNEQGVLTLASRSIHINDKPGKPLPAAFICGGQLFGPAQAFRQVPPDPYLYFHGEEITYSARLWTHGWDIFAPNDALVYHEYTQTRARPCHWHDHPEWEQLDQLSCARIRHLLGTQLSQDENVLREIERFGLGDKRLLPAYEAYADVRFYQRTTGLRAQDGRFPPPLETDARDLQDAMRYRLLFGPRETQETRAGNASRLSNTHKLREQLAEWLSQYRIKRLIDAGCGDMVWLQAMGLSELEWVIGYDIVPELVAANQALYGHKTGHLFGVADISRTPLPPADAILCRRVLECLPLQDALNALENLKASGSTYLLASTHHGAANIELIDSGFRPLDLQNAPFGMGAPLVMIKDYQEPDALQSYLAVWKL